MIYDPVIECECDVCQSHQHIEPEYKYTDYSGNNGYFDCSETAVFGLLEKFGWTNKNNTLKCGDCNND